MLFCRLGDDKSMERVKDERKVILTLCPNVPVMLVATTVDAEVNRKSASLQFSADAKAAGF